MALVTAVFVAVDAIVVVCRKIEVCTHALSCLAILCYTWLACRATWLGYIILPIEPHGLVALRKDTEWWLPNDPIN